MKQKCFKLLVDNSFIPYPEVFSIFQAFSPLLTEEQNVLLQNPTLENLNDIAQKSFLRPVNTERGDISTYSNFAKYVNPETVELFKAIGAVGDVLPKQTSYQYILINGSTIPNMKQRIESLVRLLQEEKLSLDTTEIVFLTGERDLFESEKKQTDDLATETDAAIWLWSQYPSLASKQITFISASKHSSGGRPTTKDTVIKWLETSPKPGSVISISSQPFIYYQEITIGSELAKDFTVEGVGFDHNNPKNFIENVSMYLDNLARTLYTIVNLSQSSRSDYKPPTPIAKHTQSPSVGRNIEL